MPRIQHLPRIRAFLGYVPAAYSGAAEEAVAPLLAYRRALGLSQRDLARQLGVDPGTVSRWEKGERRPSGRHAIMIDQLVQDT